MFYYYILKLMVLHLNPTFSKNIYLNTYMGSQTLWAWWIQTTTPRIQGTKLFDIFGKKSWLIIHFIYGLLN